MTTIAFNTTPDEAVAHPPITKRQVMAAVAGNALEFYDFTVYATFASQIGRNADALLYPGPRHPFTRSFLTLTNGDDVFNLQ